MHPYVASLKKLLEQHSDPVQAGPMKKYMRDQFEYLGIKSPLFKSLMKEFIAAHGTPPIYELDVILRDLWSLPEREFQRGKLHLLSWPRAPHNHAEAEANPCSITFQDNT